MSPKQIVIGIVLTVVVLVQVFLISLILFRPKSKLNDATVEKLQRKHYIVICAVLIVTILFSILPMNLSPMYNGEIEYYTNQYEKTAKAFLNGKLNIDDGDVTQELKDMDNPYDFRERERRGVKYNWDHAYYKGHYYMYFGVAPVLLVFLPYHILTDNDLLGYHATQIFTAFFILGVFLLFQLLARKFFKSMSLSVYLFLSVGFSIMSTWYIIAAPALYCTAISSALCMMIWSIYWFAKAVYDSESDNSAVAMAALGSFCGATAFACRPSIALANIVVVPLLITFLQQRKIDILLIMKLIVAALPYPVIAILLMGYNNARFEDPFEFGQAYQLTIADQHAYGNIAERIDLMATLKGAHQFLFKHEPMSRFVDTGSFLTFPILLFTLIPWLNPRVWKLVKENKLFLLLFFLYAAVAVIIFIDVLWSPVVIARYKTDILWLLSIITYIMIGLWYQQSNNKRLFGYLMIIMSLITVMGSVLLFLYPYDNNYTIFYKDKIEQAFGITLVF